MKQLRLNWLISSVLVLSMAASVFAQGTGYTYHGRLADHGSPANGNFDLTFSLFDSVAGANQLGETITNAALPVADGLFSAVLDFGPGIFTGPKRWLQIGVRTNGAVEFTPLNPRLLLTPTPYAIMANTASNLLGVLPAGQLSGIISNGQLPANLPRLDGDGTFTGVLSFANPANIFAGSGSALTDLDAAKISTGTLKDKRLSGNVALRDAHQTFSGSNTFSGVFKATNANNTFNGSFAGNGNSLTGLNPANLSPGTAAIDISGHAATATSAATAGLANSANNFTSPLAGDVTGPQGATVVLSIGGQSAASIASGASAANAATPANTPDAIVRRDGAGNFQAGAITAASVSGDGSGLTALDASQIVSGTLNDSLLSTNVAFLNADQIFRGSNTFSGVVQLTNTANILAGTFTGDLNFLGAANNDAIEFNFNGQRMLRLEPTVGSPNVIGGDLSNYTFEQQQSHPVGDTIGGGSSNSVGSGYSTIAGGTENRVESFGGSIGGGQGNHIWSRSAFCTISGGFGNALNPDIGSGATISGGLENVVSALGGTGATIGGGERNAIIGSFSHALISGGYSNRIGTSYSINFGGGESTVSGGRENFVLADRATISGGAWNAIGTTASNTHRSGKASTISGGQSNQVNGAYNTVGGGLINTVGDNVESATISGGSFNTVNGTNSTVGGGAWNVVQGASSAIAGGQSNHIGGAYSVVPGGFGNSIGADYSFAAGHRANALHKGTFVWADSDGADFTSAADNQFLIRAAGGVGIGTGGPIAQLDIRGKTSIGNAFMPLTLNASNVLNLQVGDTNDGSQNGISFLKGTNGTGMKLGYDGTLIDDDSKLVIYDGNTQPRFVFESGGNLGLGVTNPAHPIEHTSGAMLTASGVWQNASDVHRKTDFETVEPREILEKLANLNVSKWRYRTETKSIRHIGPMAQDFMAAFGLGEDEKSIGTVDADGVALAAIQGLNEIVQSQKSELRQKENEIQALQKRLEALEQAIFGLRTAQKGDPE